MKSKILLLLAISTSSAALYAQSGNVGVGTTTPLTKLHVTSTGTGGAGVFNTNLANMALRIENSGNAQSVIQHFLAKDAAGATKEFLLGINPTFNSGNGVFYMGANGSNAQVIQMDLVTGNVSMGSGPGLSKLNVGNNLSIGATYVSTAAPANGAIIQGNVGIGTSAPGGPLDVVADNAGGSGGNDVYFRGFGTSVGPAYYSLSARGTAAAPTNVANGDILGAYYIGGLINGVYGYTSNGIRADYKGTGTNDLAALLLINGNTERMRIDENGNVGIATATPGARLDVAGSLKVTDGSQGVGKVLTSDAAGLASWQTPTATSQYYDWLKAGGAQPTTAADNTGDIYHAGGKVAIGATTATGRLTVSGNGGSLTPILTLTNTNVAGNPTLNIYPGYTSNVAGIAEGNQNAVVFDQDPGLSNAGASQSLYDFHGQVRYVNASTLSDRRLKENISDMNQYGLKEVMQMQPRNYILKEYKTKDIGFIAQELKQIVPELVMGKETENSLLSVDYSKVCLVLINAIKEQQALIEKLETKNAGLNKEVTGLKAEVSKVSQLSDELNVLKASVEQLTNMQKHELASAK